MILSLAWALSLGCFGCASEPGPNEPEGGYLAFREALLSGDTAGVWDCLAEETHQVFRDAFSDLNAIASSLELLSPSDRALVEQRTAIRLLHVADDPQGLFTTLARLELVVGDDTYRMGSEIDESYQEDDDTAVVRTEAGQEVQLQREEDGVWRVSSLTDIARETLRPIADNVIAVEALVADSAVDRRSPAEIRRLLGIGEGDGVE